MPLNFNDTNICVYQIQKPTKHIYNEIFTSLFTNAQLKNVTIIACPTRDICRCLLRSYQPMCPDNIMLVDSVLKTDNEDSVIYIIPYFLAANEALISKADTVIILDGHSIASYSHFDSVNRLLTELFMIQKPFHIFLDSISPLSLGFEDICQQFIHRYNAIPSSLGRNESQCYETILQCSLTTGVEVLLGEIPFFEGSGRSECPLTDTFLSIISECIRVKRKVLVVCGNNAEAKDIAERIDSEFHELLIQQELPSRRTMLASAMKLIGGVILADNNPSAPKEDGFVSYINEHQVLMLIGEKKRLLYSGVEADVVINVVFTGNERVMFDSEYSALFNLVKNKGHVITLTDNVTAAFARFTFQPRLYNKFVIELVNSGRASSTAEIAHYFEHFFVSDIDPAAVIEDLISNGSMAEINGEFDMVKCNYLNGYYAVEKCRVLKKAYTSLNLSDTLYLFYLANLYFVDSREAANLSKSALHVLFSLPEVRQLVEKTKLHDPKLGGNHYSKLESCIIVSAVVYNYYSNSDCSILNEITVNFDRLEVFLKLNKDNLRKTAQIVQQNYGSSFSNVFKHLENLCTQFDASPLRSIRNLDFETIDYLRSNGIKTLNELTHCSNLETYLRPLASKTGQSVRSLSQQLRKDSLLKRRKSLNTSENASRDLFNISSGAAEGISFKSLCALDEPILDSVLEEPFEGDISVLQLRENGWLNIIMIAGNVSCYQYRLKCCVECKERKRLEQVLKICTQTVMFLANSLQTARGFALYQVSLKYLQNSHCLSSIAYVAGSRGLLDFIGNEHRTLASNWTVLYHNLLSETFFSQELIQYLPRLLPHLINLAENPIIKTIKAAFTVLMNFYNYGIPYRGFTSLINLYREKLFTLPTDVLKAANSNFIPVEIHQQLANNLDDLLQVKRFKKSKLCSTAAATSNQKDLFYSQLALARKLNQAIELLSSEYFTEDSGVVFPAIALGGHGRLYTHAPNLQNFAKKLPFKDLPSPRSVIAVSEKTEDLWSADFKEIELRVAALMSKDKVIVEALKSPNTFEQIASKLGLTNYPRADVKLLFYGLLYGMGPTLIEDQYGFTRDEAVSLWKRFGEAFPELNEYRNYLRQLVLDEHPLRNYFDIPLEVEKASAYSAVNAVIQSTAAFIFLKAVGNFPINDDVKVLLLVHDEIIFKAPKKYRSQIPQRVKAWMQTEIEGVEFPIKLSIGKSWDSLSVIDS